MTSVNLFLNRAARIFGKGPDGIYWPYDVSGIDYTLRRTDPERFKQHLAVLTAKRELIVEWAEQHGLRKAHGCCPRWLLKNASHRCGYQPDARTACTWGTDERWLDHPIWWIKDRRPAVVTGAPYHFDDESQARVNHWLNADGRLRFARGTGWYGHGTQQVVMWRTDRISQVIPATPKTGATS